MLNKPFFYPLPLFLQTIAFFGRINQHSHNPHTQTHTTHQLTHSTHTTHTKPIQNQRTQSTHANSHQLTHTHTDTHHTHNSHTQLRHLLFLKKTLSKKICDFFFKKKSRGEKKLGDELFAFCAARDFTNMASCIA